MKENKSGQLVGLQYLRGLAALGVVIIHYLFLLTGKSGAHGFGGDIFPARVDVFFVISGYIIWKTTQNPARQPWEWWKAHALRIVPLYWLVTLLTLLEMATLEHYWPPVGEIVRSFLLIPAHNTRVNDMVPVMTQAWSLNYQMLFYFVMSLALFLRLPRQRLLMILGLFTFLVAMRMYIDKADPVAFRMTSPLLFEFVAGILIYELLSLVRGHRALLGVASLTVCVLMIAIVPYQLMQDGPRIVSFGVPAATLVLGVLCFETYIARWVVWPLKVLGDASYSIYLTHILWMMPAIFLFTWLDIRSIWVRFLIVMLVSLAMGLLFHHWVERPLLNWLRAKRHATVAVTPGVQGSASQLPSTRVP